MPELAWYPWLLIAGTAAVSFLSRAAFVVPGSHLRLPAAVERALRYAPAAALIAIVAPDMLLAQGAWALELDNPRLLAGLAGFAIAATARGVLPTIAGGMLVLTLARLYL